MQPPRPDAVVAEIGGDLLDQPPRHVVFGPAQIAHGTHPAAEVAAAGQLDADLGGGKVENRSHGGSVAGSGTWRAWGLMGLGGPGDQVIAGKRSRHSSAHALDESPESSSPQPSRQVLPSPPCWMISIRSGWTLARALTRWLPRPVRRVGWPSTPRRIHSTRTSTRPAWSR